MVSFSFPPFLFLLAGLGKKSSHWTQPSKAHLSSADGTWTPQQIDFTFAEVQIGQTKRMKKQNKTSKTRLAPENNLKKIYFFWTKKQQTKNRILPSRFLEITATLNAGPAASSRLFLPSSPPRRRIGDQHMNPERHQRWPFFWWQVVRKSWNYQRSIGKTMTMKNSWWFTSMKKVTFFTRSSNIVRKRSFFQFLLSTNKSVPFTSQNFWAPSNNPKKSGESKPQRGSQSDASRFSAAFSPPSSRAWSFDLVPGTWAIRFFFSGRVKSDDPFFFLGMKKRDMTEGIWPTISLKCIWKSCIHNPNKPHPKHPPPQATFPASNLVVKSFTCATPSCAIVKRSSALSCSTKRMMPSSPWQAAAQ